MGATQPKSGSGTMSSPNPRVRSAFLIALGVLLLVVVLWTLWEAAPGRSEVFSIGSVIPALDAYWST